MPGYTKPNPQRINLSSGQTTHVTGNYHFARGSLVVNIQPQEAVANGGQWRVDGGPWQNSGATIPNLPEGSHTVEFRDVAGWKKPGPISVPITPGQTRQGTGLYQK